MHSSIFLRTRRGCFDRNRVVIKETCTCTIKVLFVLFLRCWLWTWRLLTVGVMIEFNTACIHLLESKASFFSITKCQASLFPFSNQHSFLHLHFHAKQAFPPESRSCLAHNLTPKNVGNSTLLDILVKSISQNMHWVFLVQFFLPKWAMQQHSESALDKQEARRLDSSLPVLYSQRIESQEV